MDFEEIEMHMDTDLIIEEGWRISSRYESERAKPSKEVIPQVFIDSSFTSMNTVENFGFVSAPESLQNKYSQEIHFEVDPNQAIEEANDWNIQLILKEKYYTPSPGFLKLHPSLNSKCRKILLDWMMEVCHEFFLSWETFHTSVNLVDWYLSVQVNVPWSQLQLIGVTSMLIAAKLEEVQCPKVEAFANTTQNGYTNLQII